MDASGPPGIVGIDAMLMSRSVSIGASKRIACRIIASLYRGNRGWPRPCTNGTRPEPNPLCKFVSATAKKNLPDRSDVVVQFHERHVPGQFLEGDRETNDSPARERLNEPGRFAGPNAEPAPEVRDEPRFPTRIAKRRTLRDGGDVDRTIRLKANVG